MRLTGVVIILALLACAHPMAQQAPTRDQKEQQLRRASRTIKIGLAVIGVGALVAPLTALSGRHPPDNHNTAMNTGIGIMAVGSGIVWWGASARRRALQPQTSIGFTVGRHKGVQISRTW